MPPAEHDIDVLNTLIETTLDSADGYSQAAAKAKQSGYKDVFVRWAEDRRQVVTQLQGQVRRLGGTPEDDGSILAAGHRMFLKLRDSVTGSDESVIDEVERGEDFIKAKYETALKDEELSAAVRDAVVQAYASVKTGHDQARDLKRQAHAKH
ncbi:PA2169 family four-helix-bundle protein [Peristeroidobacter agariperforans]|uniref:PA2169 family four-helix-bundle protein n=1 Tax=Peristeroidobacter agariperforans TaxID=268404 RepID=UPI00101D7A4C|nr:PA2169 family four-helix-bundle protein [Peristeroidobacter agariperforans]